MNVLTASQVREVVMYLATQPGVLTGIALAFLTCVAAHLPSGRR